MVETQSFGKLVQVLWLKACIGPRLVLRDRKRPEAHEINMNMLKMQSFLANIGSTRRSKVAGATKCSDHSTRRPRL